MDDGWCPRCCETTDGDCLHLEDGENIPFPEPVIIELRRGYNQSLVVAAELRKLAVEQVIEIARLKEENDKLRNITIIQEGSSIRLVIGDDDE
jgi:hypothetical protein